LFDQYRYLDIKGRYAAAFTLKAVCIQRLEIELVLSPRVFVLSLPTNLPSYSQYNRSDEMVIRTAEEIVIRTAEGMVIRTAEEMVIRTVEGMVIIDH
jgi:hypothetical protein